MDSKEILKILLLYGLKEEDLKDGFFWVMEQPFREGKRNRCIGIIPEKEFLEDSTGIGAGKWRDAGPAKVVKLEYRHIEEGTPYYKVFLIDEDGNPWQQTASNVTIHTDVALYIASSGVWGLSPRKVTDTEQFPADELHILCEKALPTVSDILSSLARMVLTNEDLPIEYKSITEENACEGYVELINDKYGYDFNFRLYLIPPSYDPIPIY